MNAHENSRRSFVVRAMTTLAGVWVGVTAGLLAAGCNRFEPTAKYGGPPLDTGRPPEPSPPKYGGPPELDPPPAEPPSASPSPPPSPGARKYGGSRP